MNIETACLLICLLLANLISTGQAVKEAVRESLAEKTRKVFDQLLPADYNKNLAPIQEDEPLQVNVSLLITDISSISENKMEFVVDFYIRQTWNDYRLQFGGDSGGTTTTTTDNNNPENNNTENSNNSSSNSSSSITGFILDDDFAQKLWLPDTYFENAKKLDIHRTVASRETKVLMILGNGHIFYATKASLTAKCSMDLTHFPIDQQRCSLQIGSYSGPSTHVTYSWALPDMPPDNSPNGNANANHHQQQQQYSTIKEVVQFTEDSYLYLPTFKLLGYNTHQLTVDLAGGPFSQPFSVLRLDLMMARNINFYLTRVYLPAFLVTIISFVPFWLDRDSHARVALGVTTVLTMTTLITNTNAELPKISHLTALDVYLFTSFLLVFSSLIEYATVGYYDMRCTKEVAANIFCPGALPRPASFGELGRRPDGQKLANSTNTSFHDRRRVSIQPTTTKIIVDDKSRIDYLARRVFPIVFLAFNGLYLFALYIICLVHNTGKIEVRF